VTKLLRCGIVAAMAADKDLNDILASIRKIVVETPATGSGDVALAPDEDEVATSVSATPPAPAPAPAPALTLAAVSEPHGPTLESTVREMLQPMLKAWLDANLPRIVADAVDTATSAEIRRLTGRD
jgi:uncharacterized protein